MANLMLTLLTLRYLCLASSACFHWFFSIIYFNSINEEHLCGGIGIRVLAYTKAKGGQVVAVCREISITIRHVQTDNSSCADIETQKEAHNGWKTYTHTARYNENVCLPLYVKRDHLFPPKQILAQLLSALL